MENNERGATLAQITFLKSIGKEIELNAHLFDSGRKLLYDYEEIPKEMEEDEWCYVVEEIRKCYESIRFLNKIALLVKADIVTTESLYIWCYKEITEDLLDKLELLVHWVGTGLDLAANYDSYELARIYSNLTSLFEQLNNIHASNGADLEAEGLQLQYDKFKSKTNAFMSNPERYSVISDDSVRCYVDIKTDIAKRKVVLEKLGKTIMDIPVRKEIVERFEAFCADYELQNVDRGVSCQASLENALLNWMNYEKEE